MIYASSSLVINISAASLWNVLEEFIRRPTQGNYVKDSVVIENYHDGFKRSSFIAGEVGVVERVFLLKDQCKMIMKLEGHPLCIGDTIYQLVYSNQEELSDRRVTLCAVLTWRMRPGVIEAPVTIDKQIILNDLLQAISEKAVKERHALV